VPTIAVKALVLDWRAEVVAYTEIHPTTSCVSLFSTKLDTKAGGQTA